MRGTLVHCMAWPDYCAAPGVHISALKSLVRSPLHYREALRARKDSPALRFGRLVHMAVFEPDDFARSCRRRDFDARTRAGKEEMAAAPLVEWVPADDFDRIAAIVDAVRTHAASHELLANGEAGVAMFWRHVTFAGADIPCKGLADWITGNMVVDLKTTRDVSPGAFDRDSFRFAYHAQLAFYLDGYEACTGRCAEATIISVEVEAPHDVAVRPIPSDVLEHGRRLYRAWIDTYAQCEGDRNWPGVAPEPVPLALPAWARNEAEQITIGGQEVEW